MKERAAFRSVPGVLLAFLFLIMPAAVFAEEAAAPPAATGLPAQAPETPGAAAPAPSAPDMAPPAGSPEASPAAPASILGAEAAPAAPPEAAPAAPSETAPAAPSETAPAAPPAAPTPILGSGEAPPAPPEAAPAAPPGAAPAAAQGTTKASDYPEGLIYSVKQGDTLWDLSAKYLGSPWLWTELWEKNRFLTNPHYIYPGIRVVIFAPPPKEYAMEGTEPAPESTAASAVQPPQPPQPSEPAPSAEQPPAVMGPEEMPRRATLDISPAEFVRAGEFLRNRPKGIGRIQGSLDPRVMFSEGDKVVLSLNKDIPAGQLLGVYRVRGPVRGPAGRRVSGYVRYLVGLVQALGPENGAFVGVVRKSFEEFTRADLIAEDIPAYTPIYVDPGKEGLQASVITGRRDNKEFSEKEFLYLDRGTDDGVAQGNQFRLFRRAVDSKYRVEVGRVVVVRASPNYSTVYVVNSTQSFEAGVTASRGEAPAR